jgi:hypothetical protein
MCRKQLKVILPEWLPYYEQEHGPLGNALGEQLCALSAPTFDRWLSPYRQEASFRRGWSGTKPETLLKQHIPIKVDHWNVTQPGFLEADTVATAAIP